jgi:hypothetical protein
MLNAQEMVDASHEYATQVRRHSPKPRVTCLNRSAVGIEFEKCMQDAGRPKLVLTSPPYPGLHVLYHRWQVKGRRETPAPFWVDRQGGGSRSIQVLTRAKVGRRT